MELTDPPIYLENLTNWNDTDLASILKAAYAESRRTAMSTRVIRVEHWRGPTNEVCVVFESNGRIAVLKIPRPKRFKSDAITLLGRLLDTSSDSISHPFLKHVCLAAHRLMQGHSLHTGHAQEAIDKIDWAGQLALRCKKVRRRFAPESTRAKLAQLKVNYAEAQRTYARQSLKMQVEMAGVEAKLIEDLALRDEEEGK